MIRLNGMSVTKPATLSLIFSDGSSANWSAEELIARNTIMTRPLADPKFFARAFIEAGALAWPNGFELSATNLHRRLAASGALIRPAA
jgi:hypothetical protein